MQIRILTAILIAAMVTSSCNNKEGEMTKTEYKWPDSIAVPVAEKKG